MFFFCTVKEKSIQIQQRRRQFGWRISIGASWILGTTDPLPSSVFQDVVLVSRFRAGRALPRPRWTKLGRSDKRRGAVSAGTQKKPSRRSRSKRKIHSSDDDTTPAGGDSAASDGPAVSDLFYDKKDLTRRIKRKQAKCRLTEALRAVRRSLAKGKKALARLTPDSPPSLFAKHREDIARLERRIKGLQQTRRALNGRKKTTIPQPEKKKKKKKVPLPPHGLSGLRRRITKRWLTTGRTNRGAGKKKKLTKKQKADMMRLRNKMRMRLLMRTLARGERLARQSDHLHPIDPRFLFSDDRLNSRVMRAMRFEKRAPNAPGVGLLSMGGPDGQSLLPPLIHYAPEDLVSSVFFFLCRWLLPRVFFNVHLCVVVTHTSSSPTG